jgi:RNA polymerase sigma-70 factor (ECF subfamily)
VSFNNGNNQAEGDLIKRVLQGDTAAFGFIIKNTEHLVAQIVYKMVHNAEDRKDMMQDIYVKAYKSLASFQFRSQLSTWIGHIAYNTCVNYLEKKKLVLHDYSEEDAAWEGITCNETEELVLQKDLTAILNTEIEKLTPLYKILIVLFHKEEASYADIAQVTNLPVGTIKNYLFRARKKIKENILSQYKKEEL